MKLALLCPHIFMQDELLDKVIFSPGKLAIELADELINQNIDVTIFSPGKVTTKAKNIIGDLSGFQKELNLRGYGFLELLNKHPLLFATLSRQVQSELVKDCFKRANLGEFDLVHVYMNEEELSYIFSEFCKIPVVFSHHDPYNFLAKYRALMPKYKNLNWISISYSQRKQMPADTNWIGNTYHGLNENLFEPSFDSAQDDKKKDYFLYLGRIIESKGVHLAIAAAKKAGVKLKIAGKFYGSESKNKYWEEKIKPALNDQIEYIGFVSDVKEKNNLLKDAKALIVPSTFEEPFGMVLIEALASGTPVIGLDSGAIGEIVKDGVNGYLVKRSLAQEAPHPPLPWSGEVIRRIGGVENLNESKIIDDISTAIQQINQINREACRKDFEERFTLKRMTKDYIEIYERMIN